MVGCLPAYCTLDADITQGVTHDLEWTARDLLRFLNPDIDKSNMKTLPPVVVLAFDESHVLAIEKHQFDTGTFSKFSELRRALRALNVLPIFSVFLSTSGKIQNFTPRPDEDDSGRVQKSELVLLPPFTELGFDQMASKISDGKVTIEEVSELDFMVRFGRPL